MWRKLWNYLRQREKSEMRDEHHNMGSDPAFVKNLDAVVQASQTLVRMAVKQGCPDHGPAKLTMAIAALTGPLAAIAILSSKDGDLTEDMILFAALLAAKATGAEGGGDHISLSFSPGTILEAMEAFEKLTGKKADDVICEGMAEAARSVESAAIIPLERFMQAARDKGRLN